jgi:ubiquinone/menaquinone biosynthesis C-methylase UbiE
MTVMDIGCGPGFFTVEMARMVGISGLVIACDQQQGMLDIVRGKIQGSEIESRIIPHLCVGGRLGVTEAVDFALAFFMIHEVPDKDSLFAEVYSILKPDGRFLIVEPPFHVSKAEFGETVRKAMNAGFEMLSRPKVTFCKTALFGKR